MGFGSILGAVVGNMVAPGIGGQIGGGCNNASGGSKYWRIY